MTQHGYKCSCDNCLPKLYADSQKFGREQEAKLKDELACMKPLKCDWGSIDFNALVKRIRKS